MSIYTNIETIMTRSRGGKKIDFINSYYGMGINTIFIFRLDRDVITDIIFKR